MNKKAKLIVIILLAVTAVNVGFALIYFYLINPEEASVDPVKEAVAQAVKPEAASVLNDDYYSMHFSFNDAVDLCVAEARSRNSNIIQLVMNEHSTRYKEEENMYLVMLDSHVGTPLLYDEKGHTCDIDPEVQGVAFYREIVKRAGVRPVR